MGFLESIVLGIVQGFTEFLPVSSSGHLTLLQGLMGLNEVPILYDVMLHVGTLIAVFIVLWPEIVAIITHPVKNKLGMLILATIPAVVVTLIAEKLAPEEMCIRDSSLSWGPKKGSHLRSSKARTRSS